MPGQLRVRRHMRTTTRRCADLVVADLAYRQHGVITRWQLRDVGVSRDAIRRRLERGRLHRVHRGVYAVGHEVLTPQARFMAAVLACGPCAALSHRSAGTHRGLGHWRYLEITAPTKRVQRHVLVHVSPLPPDEVNVVEGIPTTSLPRTLLDLAAVLRPHELERAFNEANVRGLDDPLSVPDLIARYPHRKGVGAIRKILDIGPAFTRSDFEALFLELVRTAGLPEPRPNYNVLGFECDCVWPD